MADIDDLKESADAGDPAAIFELATCFATGHEVPIDAAKAFDLYKNAAQRGHLRAMVIAADHYNRGFCTEKDGLKALLLMIQAAEGGETTAMDPLASADPCDLPDDLSSVELPLTITWPNLVGILRPSVSAARSCRDRRLSDRIRLLEILAKYGNCLAMCALGQAYEHGDGTIKDYVAAYMWSNLAAAHGSKDAAAIRDRLEQRMSQGCVEEAHARSRQWLAEQPTEEEG